MGAGASDYFILSAIVLHESYWTDVMVALGNQRSEFMKVYRFDTSRELHAGEMIGRTGKKYGDINKSDRLMMLRNALKLESTIRDIRVINVVVDKRNKGFEFDVFATAWDTLINRFENTIEHGNFPNPRRCRIEDESCFDDKGMIIVDETDEVKLRLLIRKMRHKNLLPSRYGQGETVRHDLKYVIEDPLHKQSETSMLIQ